MTSSIVSEYLGANLPSGSLNVPSSFMDSKSFDNCVNEVAAKKKAAASCWVCGQETVVQLELL